MTTDVSPFFKIAVRLLAAVLTAGALLFLLQRAVVPEGRLTTVTDLTGPAPFVSEPKPSERLADPAAPANGSAARRLIGSPLYLDLAPPSDFASVVMSVRYANAGQNVIELGAMSSSLDGQFVLKPAENELIDSLSWPRVASGALTLLQRDKRYASLDEFFRSPPDRAKVATYHASATSLPYAIPDYVASGTSRTVVMSLRGSHRMLTYVKDEPLSFSFSVQDMNRHEGADPVIASVYREGASEPIARTVLQDDGDTGDDQRSSKLRAVAVSVSDPAEGVYKIEFTSTADVFIREITTRQKKLVFEDRLYLGDHVGYSDKASAVTVWTDGRRVTARTAHPESLQTITVGKRAMVIDQVNADFFARVDGPGPVAINAPKRGILIWTDGVFALSSDEWFDPRPYPVEWFTSKDDLDRAGIDFLLTAYEPPAVSGDLKTAVAVFDAGALARTKDGDFRFVIAAPGIADTHEDLRIKDVSFTMHRDPLSLGNAWQRLAALFAPRGEPVLRVISDGTSYGESVP